MGDTSTSRSHGDDVALTTEAMLRRTRIGGDGIGPLPATAMHMIKCARNQAVAGCRAKACGKCGGTGYVEQYAHNGGQCFACRRRA